MAIHVAIEGYDSLEQIGVGGMAAVYKARKVSIDKTVAIKVLFPYLATDASFIDRFQREAKAAASIQHENIVNVIDFGESEGSFFIVMEYYDGQSLENLMKARPGIPTDISAQILLEVAFGLEAAHALDIVHRDIKPGNIIFTNQGGIKIADFGLAKKSDSMTMITQLGKVMGTPAYMSPEQAAGRPVGPQSDIFSLGVVAYELFSRRKPFEGKSYSEVLEKIQTCDPPAVTHANPLIGEEFEQIVSRMLQKDERERYPSASALIADLEAAMEKNKFPRDRRRMVSYAKDPEAYDASFNEKTVAGCLSRGSYFLQKGRHHLDDAELEFRRILFLDPANERARKHLDQIRAKSGGPGRTVTIDASPSTAVPASHGTASARTTARTNVRGARSSSRPRLAVPRWVFGIVVTLAVGTGAAAWLTRDLDSISAEHAPDRDAAPTLAATLNPPAIALVDTTTGRPGRTDTTAARKSPLTRESNQVVTGDERAASDPPGTESKPGVAETRKGTEPKVPPTSGPAPGRETVQLSAAKPERPAVVTRVEHGTLSVFFLGGVGELLVNGRKFSQQPPFEDVPLAAGTYRMACRMSGDEAPREIVVNIRPNAETVIEYEVGGVPVVSTSP